ncbi:MAG: protease inhibitor I42 family protein [bacterium]
MVGRRSSWVRSSPLLGLLLLLVLTLALVSTAGCGSDTPADTESTSSTETTEESTVPESLQLTREDDGGSFEILAGGTIAIDLKANPSTGYFWELDDPDPEASLLEQVGEPAFESDNPDAMGAGGTLTFTFRAVDKGEMIIKLVYLAPEVDQAPADTFQIDLTVR